MARNEKGPPDQAKHFQHDDHAHAAHQEDAAHDHAQKPSSEPKGSATDPTGKTIHPAETTPKGPSKGQ